VGAHSAPTGPDVLAGFKGSYFREGKWDRGENGEGKKKWEERGRREGRGGEG